MGPLAIAGAGTSVLGGVVGNLASAGDRRDARDKMSEAMGELMSLGMPPDLSKRLVLEQYQQAGMLTPELEQEIALADPLAAKIQEDPRLREAQMQALASMQQRGKMGLTAQDRALLNQTRQEVQRDVRGAEEAAIMDAAARGQGGSGNELVARLNAQQAGANRASMEGDRTAAMAQQNALSALSQSGQLGSDLRARDFDINRSMAQSADEAAVRRFNEAVARQQRNIGSKNVGQQFNVERGHEVSDRNVAMANRETERQANAQRQFWEDQKSRAQMRATGLADASKMSREQAAATAKQWADIGSGSGKILSGLS